MKSLHGVLKNLKEQRNALDQAIQDMEALIPAEGAVEDEEFMQKILGLFYSYPMGTTIDLDAIQSYVCPPEGKYGKLFDQVFLLVQTGKLKDYGQQIFMMEPSHYLYYKELNRPKNLQRR